MKFIKTTILFIGIVFLFTNCNFKNKNLEIFFENEKQNMETSINKIFSSLGLENIEIIIHNHRSISNRIVSKSVSDTNWHGSDFNPEYPNNNESVFRDMSNLYGWMRQRTITANYDLNAKNEIVYEYFSIIIIIENINQRQKNELIRILDTHLINVERGDTIFIISKDEFNNL